MGSGPGGWNSTPRRGPGAIWKGSGSPCHGTEEITGITAWFGGRVKTLHPKLFGGILAPRDEGGRRELETLGLVP
ncbi:phosphoribosylaminoimidazolecarboxamide formyltransferase/IMP cyclohydrolase, partial [mine drainage metagenome]